MQILRNSVLLQEMKANKIIQMKSTQKTFFSTIKMYIKIIQVFQLNVVLIFVNLIISLLAFTFNSLLNNKSKQVFNSNFKF